MEDRPVSPSSLFEILSFLCYDILDLFNQKCNLWFFCYPFRIFIGKRGKDMLDAKLETLLVVADCKSFTKAAKLLSLTQPAVSHHIELLERECNATLFLRGKGEFRLTKEGEIAVTYARRLKALHQKMLSKIEDEKRHISRFRIGITHTSENNTITEALAKYAVQSSEVSITIITEPINILYDMLENYELDIAIVEGKRLSAKLNYFMLDTDYLVCVVSNENPLSKQSMVTVNELKKEKMILRLPTSATRKLFEASLLGINESIDGFNVSLEVDNVGIIKDLVRKDFGISVLPKSACISDFKKAKLKILPIENLSMMREMNIAYHKDFSHLEVIKDIVQLYQHLILPN